MAKKQTTVSKSELLEAAIVPIAEQPYKIPANWVWTYLLSGASQCLDSYRKPVNASERSTREGDIPYYGATGQVGWIDDYLTDEQLVLLGEDGAPFLDPTKNKAYIIEGKAWVNNHAHILRSFFGQTGNVYLMHYLNSFDYAGFVNGTTRLKLTQGSMAFMPVPLPPLAEQQRIVDRIESLFSKLDEAKEKAQEVVDGYDARRAAILHKAFTGELTEKWRSVRGVKKDSWLNTDLSHSVLSFKYGTSEKSTYENTGMPVFRIPNVTDLGLSFENLKYLPHDDIPYESQIHENEILIIRSNGSRDLVGKSVLVPHLDQQYAYASFLIKAVPAKKIDPAFLVYYLNSADARNQMFKKAKSTAGINNINSKELGEITISIPPLQEQAEIVSILDKLLEEEMQAVETAKNAIGKIEQMKKAILARAFRGEIGTNDLADESAVELLKKALSVDVPAPQRTKPVTIPKELSKTLRNDLEKKIVKLYFQRETTVLPAKEIMSVSSKTFDVLECLRSLQERQIISKQENGNFILMR